MSSLTVDQELVPLPDWRDGWERQPISRCVYQLDLTSCQEQIKPCVPLPAGYTWGLLRCRLDGILPVSPAEFDDYLREVGSATTRGEIVRVSRGL